MKRAYRLLRSRKLAIWLILGVIGYSLLATFVPLGAPESPEVAAWALEHPLAESVIGPLGAHRPFMTPVFIAAVLVLMASTAACSVERTQRALAFWRMGTRPTASGALLTTRPSFTVPVTGRSVAVAVTQGALNSLGMRVTDDGDQSTGVRHVAGIFGSPVFHWALVALMAFSLAGQLMRSEGVIPVVTGSASVDEPGAYLPGRTAGPLSGGGYTGMEFEVSKIRAGFTAGGVGRGDTPYVVVRRKGKVVAEGLTYPNHPLRVGTVVVHRGELGPAILVTASASGRDFVRRQPVPLLDDASGESGASGTQVIEGSDAETSTDVRFVAAKGGKVVVMVPSADFRSVPVGTGEVVELPGGLSVRIDGLTVFSRLTIVNDWSVPLIYAAFILAVVGECVALLIMPRIVVTAYRPAEGDLAVWVLRKKLDPAFPARVERAFGFAHNQSEKERS